MFGGVTRHGADLAFCRDLYTLDTGTMTWSEVKLGYSLPNARYGHTMGVVAPRRGQPGSSSQGRDGGGGGGGSGRGGRGPACRSL